MSRKFYTEQQKEHEISELKEEIQNSKSELEKLQPEFEQYQKKMQELQQKKQKLDEKHQQSHENVQIETRKIIAELKQHKQEIIDKISDKTAEQAQLKKEFSFGNINLTTFKEKQQVISGSLQKLQKDSDDLDLDEWGVHPSLNENEHLTQLRQQRRQIEIEIEEIGTTIANFTLDPKNKSLEARIFQHKHKIKNNPIKIEELKQELTYSEEDALKYKNLCINPEDPDDQNALIERWREEYQEYAKKHNVLPEYFGATQLIKNYFMKKKYEHPEIHMYYQNLCTDIIESVIFDTASDADLAKSFSAELALLRQVDQKLAEGEPASLQTELIAACNMHRLNKMDLDSNDYKDEFELKCPVHYGCSYIKGDARCDGETKMYAELDEYYREKAKKIQNFNILMTIEEIDYYWNVELW